MVAYKNASLKETPPEYIMYRISEKFGWTINDILEQPSETLQAYIVLIGEDNLQQKRKNDSSARNSNSSNFRKR
uniref:Uncharacterized protein n=1 Tax=viral metagenome TaxID=1070528 RepID=A0A6M3JDK4_9ZZZZ